jgi:hypothetical protein
MDWILLFTSTAASGEDKGADNVRNDGDGWGELNTLHTALLNSGKLLSFCWCAITKKIYKQPAVVAMPIFDGTVCGQCADSFSQPLVVSRRQRLPNEAFDEWTTTTFIQYLTVWAVLLWGW